jgi:hypothetical protein
MVALSSLIIASKAIEDEANVSSEKRLPEKRSRVRANL